MERQFGLIKNDQVNNEKRVLPRFPFCYMTFKGFGKDERVFEVKDISFTGMQLGLKNGEHLFNVDDNINGIIRWNGIEFETNGKVKWTTKTRLGVSFLDPAPLYDFLSIKNIASSLRPIHRSGMELDIPRSLKYWLRTDGPVEIFVWQEREISKFQIIIMDKFIEWENGIGVRSGKVISKRSLETPLLSEDEFIFHMDEMTDSEKIYLSLEVILEINPKLMSQETIDFIKVKLRT